MEKIRVGILFGGMCSEREVSLNSGRNVYDNLDRERYEVLPLFMDGEGRLWLVPWQLVSQNTTVDLSERTEKEAKRIFYEDLPGHIDFAFICLHGKYGDDGCVQGLLELLGIPYTGSGVLASAVGMDKVLQQKILEEEGISVPRSLVVTGKEWAGDREGVAGRLEETFGYPLVTKPPREGSSVGVTIVRDRASLPSGMEEALAWDSAVLVEEFIEGTEFSAIVLEDGPPRVLSVTEILPQSAFFTYDDKYMPGRCRKFTPPRSMAKETVRRIEEEVLRAYRALGFRSYGRIDGFVTGDDDRVLITDPNSSSGMAPSSFFFEQAAEAGLLPSMILTELIEASRKIHGRKKGPL